MGPTVHDVRGAPVPGVSGVAPRPVPGAVRFGPGGRRARRRLPALPGRHLRAAARCGAWKRTG